MLLSRIKIFTPKSKNLVPKNITYTFSNRKIYFAIHFAIFTINYWKQILKSFK